MQTRDVVQGLHNFREFSQPSGIQFDLRSILLVRCTDMTFHISFPEARLTWSESKFKRFKINLGYGLFWSKTKVDENDSWHVIAQISRHSTTNIRTSPVKSRKYVLELIGFTETKSVSISWFCYPGLQQGKFIHLSLRQWSHTLATFRGEMLTQPLHLADFRLTRISPVTGAPSSETWDEVGTCRTGGLSDLASVWVSLHDLSWYEAKDLT